jgi:hypothetical protein
MAEPFWEERKARGVNDLLKVKRKVIKIMADIFETDKHSL